MNIFLLIISLMAPVSLSAYIDPGTGSYFMQFLTAGLFGGLFALKTYWRSIKAFFIRSKKS